MLLAAIISKVFTSTKHLNAGADLPKGMTMILMMIRCWERKVIARVYLRLVELQCFTISANNSELLSRTSL